VLGADLQILIIAQEIGNSYIEQRTW